MDRINEHLQQLWRRVARKRQLQARIDGLRVRRAALFEKVAQLEKIAIDEEADVVRLEGRSLAAFFYQAVGKMNEKLDQERREARAAKVKFDAAARELQAVEEDLAAYSGEISTLVLAEEHLRMCLEEKAALLKASANPDAMTILHLETCMQTVEWQINEIHEAIDAGKTALFMTKSIQTVLESVESWAVRDLFGGDPLKPDTLDGCQTQIEQLQVQLRRFQTELADVKIDEDIQSSFESFECFADCLFDGLFADWVMMDRIEQALAQLKRTRNRIESVLSRLEGMLAVGGEELQNLRTALEEQIIVA